MKAVALVILVAACGHQRPQQAGGDAAGGGDSGGGGHDARGLDDGGMHDASGTHDGGGMHDSSAADAFVPRDAPAGIISGGPCISGATGATGFRIRWAGTTSGSTAYVVYEKDGMPQGNGDRAGAYGQGQIGFTPTFVDPYLGDGGVALDGSDFIDMYISTAGVSSITQATLSIYGRSYNTTASGGFNWQSLDDVGQTADDFVSNVAPYQWYSADMTSAIGPGESGYLLRLRAGGQSGSLVVNRVELCLVAQ
jgi:hypothetical protein